MNKWHSKCRSLVLYKKKCAYYTSVLHRRAAGALHRALNCIRHNATKRLYCKIEKWGPSQERYALKEPKLDMKQIYVKLIKQKIAQKHTLRRKLLNAFKSARKPLAEKIKTSKLSDALVSIASRRLLQ